MRTSENAIFVTYELQIKCWNIFINSSYYFQFATVFPKWLNIEISVRFTELKASWIILIFEKNQQQKQVSQSGRILDKNPQPEFRFQMRRLSVEIPFEFFLKTWINVHLLPPWLILLLIIIIGTEMYSKALTTTSKATEMANQCDVVYTQEKQIRIH